MFLSDRYNAAICIKCGVHTGTIGQHYTNVLIIYINHQKVESLIFYLVFFLAQ